MYGIEINGVDLIKGIKTFNLLR